ncbi:hypothetical protein BD779DRAFT_330775 [Infundibulicybe gibba]|nr:hypothetical protein BD779DRAFT_330775 [Infundibulicybe gibba]
MEIQNTLGNAQPENLRCLRWWWANLSRLPLFALEPCPNPTSVELICEIKLSEQKGSRLAYGSVKAGILHHPSLSSPDYGPEVSSPTLTSAPTLAFLLHYSISSSYAVLVVLPQDKYSRMFRDSHLVEMVEIILIDSRFPGILILQFTILSIALLVAAPKGLALHFPSL